MKTISKLEAMVQGPVTNYLNKCLYTVNMGTNDYINNYFMPQYYPTRNLYNPDQFSTLLVARYRAQLQVFIYFFHQLILSLESIFISFDIMLRNFDEGCF